MTPTLSPVAGLRRAVCIDPASDDARLVLADALDESGDPMQAKWAELIRCGCELAAIPDPPPEPSVGMRSASRSQRLAALHVWSMQWKAKYYALRARESALLRELVPWLRRGERCGSCNGLGVGLCPTCRGRGWLGLLAEQVPVNAVSLGIGGIAGNWLIPATFTRGFVSRVELTTAQVQDTGFMRRLFGEWPVTEVAYTGRIGSWATVLSSREIVSLGRAAAGLPQIVEGK